MSERKAISLLGISRKAGLVCSGGFSVEQAVKSGKAELVIVAADASDNTKKKFSNMCSFYRVPWATFLDKERLGQAIGREYRSCLAVTDHNLAEAINKQIADSGVTEERWVQ